MNIENMKAAIAIMQRVIDRGDKVDMVNWQTTKSGYNTFSFEPIAKTEDELHACGNAACFAGYVAISPEWRAAGGFVLGSAAPSLAHNSQFNPHPWNLSNESGIAAWLDLPIAVARRLVRGDLVTEWDEEAAKGRDFSRFYDRWWTDVTAQNVIEKLMYLLDTPPAEGFDNEE